MLFNSKYKFILTPLFLLITSISFLYSCNKSNQDSNSNAKELEDNSMNNNLEKESLKVAPKNEQDKIDSLEKRIKELESRADHFEKKSKKYESDIDYSNTEYSKELRRKIFKCMFFARIESDSEIGKTRQIDKMKTYKDLETFWRKRPGYQAASKDYFKYCNESLDLFFLPSTNHVISTDGTEKAAPYEPYFSQNFEYEEKEILSVYKLLYSYLDKKTHQRPPIYLELLSSLALKNYIYLFLEIAPFYSLKNDSEIGLYTQEELANPTSTPPFTLALWLNMSQDFLDIAIDQQKVLTGEFLMAYLLKDLKSPDKTLRTELLELLKHAKLLAKNLFTQDIKKTLIKTGSSQSLNDIQFSVKNIENLRKEFSSWDFINDNGSLRVVYRVANDKKKVFNPESDIILELSFKDGKIDYSRPGPLEKDSDDGFIYTQGLKTFKNLQDKNDYILTERLKTLMDLKAKVDKEIKAKTNYAEKFSKN